MARPRKEQQIDIPRRAVEAAIQLIDQHEASTLTLAEVAKAVGCRAPALYTHFANKDALLRAVHDRGFRMMLEWKLAIAVQNADDALGRLREGGLAYLHFARDHPGLYRLMFSPPPAANLSTATFSMDPGRQCLDLLHSAVEACQAEGFLPDRDTGRFAFFLWSIVHGAATLVLQNRAPVRDGEDPMTAATGAVETVMQFISASRTRPLNHHSN